jgi:hypothetical protein
MFIRNETTGLTGTLSILNPNGTVFNSWNYNSNGNYNASYRGFSKLLPTIAGTYTFKAVYNGITCTSTFNIATTTGINESDEVLKFNIYPNPANNSVNIMVDESMVGSTLTLTDITGRKIQAIQLQSLSNKLETTHLASGIYYVSSGNNSFAPRKLVIE